jgi:DNA polymerase/3'-5' exonuclease PolX
MSLKKIIDALSQLAEINKFLNQPFKVRAYYNAINSLKKLPIDIKIKSCEDLLEKYYLPGLSNKGSICAKINEFIENGTIKELERVSIFKNQQELMEVKDIGAKLAKKLINEYGVKSIADLKKKVKDQVITLTKNQTLGLMYHEHLKKRIPRKEVTRVTNSIKLALKGIKSINKIEVTGSYRRGLSSSGDIDILILTNKNGSLKEIVDILIKKGLLYPDYFSIGSTKFQGLIPSKIVHQIDIRLINDPNSYVTALMYFTGSKNFNQTIRQKAMKMGYKLSEYSLLNINTGKAETVKTERDIFNILKMKYLPPNQRE